MSKKSIIFKSLRSDFKDYESIFSETFNNEQIFAGKINAFINEQQNNITNFNDIIFTSTRITENEIELSQVPKHFIATKKFEIYFYEPKDSDSNFEDNSKIPEKIEKLHAELKLDVCNFFLIYGGAINREAGIYVYYELYASNLLDSEIISEDEVNLTGIESN